MAKSVAGRDTGSSHRAAVVDSTGICLRRTGAGDKPWPLLRDITAPVPLSTHSLVKLLLIDGHYYVYRSFFAIRQLSNSRGEPTNAIYGFVKTVRRMVKDLAPDLGAVVWDMGMPQRRVALQPAYKQQRAEMPELMIPQLTFIQEIVPL